MGSGRPVSKILYRDPLGKLNNIVFTLLATDEALDALGTNQVLHMPSSLWQVGMDEVPQQNTEFTTTHGGLFEFNACPLN